MEKCIAYLCVVTACSSAVIGGIVVGTDLVVPRGDGSFHSENRKWATPEVFSNGGKFGVSLPRIFEVCIMFKQASLCPGFCGLCQICIPALQNKEHQKSLWYFSNAVIQSNFQEKLGLSSIYASGSSGF